MRKSDIHVVIAILLLFCGLSVHAGAQSADQVSQLYEDLKWRSIGPAVMEAELWISMSLKNNLGSSMPPSVPVESGRQRTMVSHGCPFSTRKAQFLWVM